MLTQLVYISRHDGTGDADSFAKSNATSGVSNILLSTDRHYVHLIEGHRIDVNSIYNKAVQDTIHTDCTLLRYIDVKKREFYNWNSEHVNISEFQAGTLNLLLPAGDIEITTISSAQAVTMMRRIHAHLLVKKPLAVSSPAHIIHE